MEGPDGEPFPIHHVVNINFGAFRKAVDKLGCFYVDVDRRYYNDNAPPVQSPTNYATIDIKPGYQKLCGQDSLDFVRFRHLDTDIVRGARQQHYLSLAKDQTGVDELFRDREELLELFGRYTDTDIRSTPAILRLLKLTYESSRDPLRRVKFRADLGHRVRDDRAATSCRRSRTSSSTPRPPRARAGADEAARASSAEATAASSPRVPGPRRGAGSPARTRPSSPRRRSPFPVYYPRLMKKGSRYWDGFGTDAPRTYTLLDERQEEAPRLPDGHRGARASASTTASRASTGRTRRSSRARPRSGRSTGRKLLLFRDGSRLRMVAWKTDKGAYWVSNTLLRSLTNQQMLGHRALADARRPFWPDR